MRLLQTEITPFTNNSLHIEFRDQAYLSSPLHGRPCFHSHPELELVFIVEGYGKRIIGNNVSPYESGDMVFIGPNVPHIWLSDPAFYKKDSIMRSKVIVMYINPKIFEPMLAFVTEFDGVNEMLQQAAKGINIFGETRNSISEKLIALASNTGFEKAIGFLQIMHMISISDFDSADEQTVRKLNNSSRGVYPISRKSPALAVSIYNKDNYTPQALIVAPLNSRHLANGMKTFFDGELGTFNANSPASATNWAGFINNDMEVLLEYNKPVSVNSVALNMLIEPETIIFPPSSIEIWGGATKARMRLITKFKPAHPQKETKPFIQLADCKFKTQKISYLKIIAKPLRKLPGWHKNNGKPALLLVDEILIN